MKKIFKIIGLYLLFGAVLAVIVSVSGAFGYFMSYQSLSSGSYIALMVLIVLLWLPVLALILPSAEVYFPFAYVRVIIAVTVVVFLLLCVRMLRKK